ncbi:MAG: EAL domain-containing protein, partial [Cytophagaceae bacterium]
VASIARDLSIGTVAEGVETIEQLEWIRSVGCCEAQGYLFSRPLPLADATAMICSSGCCFKHTIQAEL